MVNLTPTGFWVITLILCALALIVVTAEILRDRREDDQEAPHNGHRPAEQVYDQTQESA